MRNADVRDKFIKQMGQERFDRECLNSERLAKYRDIPVPPRYSWVWGHFIAIWQQCELDFCGNKVLTYRTINDYVECMKVPLSVPDKRLIMRMKAWALEQIHDMDPENGDEE